MQNLLGKRSRPDEHLIKDYIESLGAQKVLKIIDEDQAPKSEHREKIGEILDKFDYNIKSALYQINTK